MRMTRQAQLKMMESMMVIVIFIFLIGVALIFYGGVQRQSLKNYATEKSEMGAIILTQDIAFLPELSCTDKNVAVDTCVDLYKAQALYAVLNDPTPNIPAQLYYRQKFQNTNISFKIVYPPSRKTDWEPIYTPDLDDDGDGVPDVRITGKQTAELPVAIKDPSQLYNEYSVGLLRVEVLNVVG